jgi:hypothetical protein
MMVTIRSDLMRWQIQRQLQLAAENSSAQASAFLTFMVPSGAIIKSASGQIVLSICRMLSRFGPSLSPSLIMVSFSSALKSPQR